MAVASAPVPVRLDGGPADLPRRMRIVALPLPLQLAGAEHLADALGRPSEDLRGLIDAVGVPSRLLPHGGIVPQQGASRNGVTPRTPYRRTSQNFTSETVWKIGLGPESRLGKLPNGVEGRSIGLLLAPKKHAREALRYFPNSFSTWLMNKGKEKGCSSE